MRVAEPGSVGFREDAEVDAGIGHEAHYGHTTSNQPVLTNVSTDAGIGPR